LANRFGCRIVSIVGSVIAGVFFAISQFSPNIEVLILTYGVMGGELLMLHLLFIIYHHHLHHHRHFLYRKRQNEPDRKAQIVNKNMHSPGATFTCNNGAFFKNYKHKCILKRISRVFISDIFCDFIFFRLR